MSFSALPAVLVQLIMQQLDLTSLLRLARCNRSCLSAACTDLTFRFVAPLALCSLQRECAPLIKGSRLLRYVRIDMLWVTPSHKGGESLESIAGVVCYPRLHGLDARFRGHLLWHDLLRHSSLRELRVLRLDLYDWDRASDCAESLSLLTNLSDVALTCHARPVLMEALADLPRLTALNWTPCHSRLELVSPEAAQHLSNCVKLKRLTLQRIRCEDLNRILTDRMTELVEFTLISPSGVASLNCLNFVPNLREATFMLCRDAAQQAPLDLHPSSSLKLVTFVLEHSPEISWNLHRDQIQTMLHKFPQVRIHFEMWSQLRFRLRARNHVIYSTLDKAELKPMRALMLRALKPLCAINPQRVAVTQPPLMQTPGEVAASLRERFSNPKKSACRIA